MDSPVKIRNKKAPTEPGAFAKLPPRLDAGATRDEALAARGGRGQLNGQRDLALVPQKAQLDGPVLIIALCREFFAKLADGANTLAVERGDDVTGFHASLFGGRTGVDVANENSLAIGSAEKCSELPAEIFGIDAQPRLPAHERGAVPLHRRDFWHLRHPEGEGPGRRGHHLHGVAALFGFAKSCADSL